MMVFQNIANEWAKGVLDDVENLTEERIGEVLRVYQRLQRRFI